VVPQLQRDYVELLRFLLYLHQILVMMYKAHLWKFFLQKQDYNKTYPAIHNNCQDRSGLQQVL